MLLINYLGEIDLTIRNEVTKALVDTRDTLSVLNSTSISIPFPRSTETIQIVGVSNRPMTVSISLPILVKNLKEGMEICSRCKSLK